MCHKGPQSKTQWHDVAHEKNTPEAQHAAKEQAYTGMLLFIVDKNNQIHWSDVGSIRVPIGFGTLKLYWYVVVC